MPAGFKVFTTSEQPVYLYLVSKSGGDTLYKKKFNVISSTDEVDTLEISNELNPVAIIQRMGKHNASIVAGEKTKFLFASTCKTPKMVCSGADISDITENSFFVTAPESSRWVTLAIHDTHGSHYSINLKVKSK